MVRNQNGIEHLEREEAREKERAEILQHRSV
jgi:hypothetical protein